MNAQAAKDIISGASVATVEILKTPLCLTNRDILNIGDDGRLERLLDDFIFS